MNVDTTILTFPSGGVVRELIVDVDDAVRPLAYTVVEGVSAGFDLALGRS